MPYLYALIGLISGLLVGGGFVWLLRKNQAATAEAIAKGEAGIEIAALKERLEGRENDLSETRSRLDDTERKLETRETQLNAEAREKAALEPKADRVPALEEESRDLREETTHLKSTVSELRTKLEEEKKQGAEKLALLNEARDRLKMEFQNIANKILDEKSQKFTDLNKANLDGIVNPLKERIKDFEKKVDETYARETRERQSLKTVIEELEKHNKQIQEDAINLTNALKGESKTRGDWGEVILERVLEQSGLKKGREYEIQESVRDEEGRLLRPDVIVHLPENKDLIVDSKVSLVAYERYFSAKDEGERAENLKQHLASIRAHCKGLSGKNYTDLPGVRTLDFVLMFMPVEGAFMLALEHDYDVFREAFERNVLIVSPSTLLVTLRTIQNIWRYEDQNRNAREIAKKAGDMHDKFVGFVENLEKVGARIDQARSSYVDARSQLAEGPGNLVKRAMDLRKLGAKTKKDFPKAVENAAEPETRVIEMDGVEE